MMPDVPDIIIEDILSRLPTKSLLCFSSVSKQWFCLVTDPYFIQSHLKHVLSDQYYSQNQKLMVTDQYSSPFYSVDCESPKCNRRKLQNLPFLAPYGVTVLGSCNGLLCIGIHKYEEDDYDEPRYDPIIIWNPLFKNYRTLSGSLQVISDFGESWLLGFGYDSLTDDYKFVKANLRKNSREVYTTKANSWRSIPVECDLSHFHCQSADVGTFFNGSIYWFAPFSMDLSISQYHAPTFSMLIEFDLKSEKFGLVELPIGQYIRAKLFVVKGCLGVFYTSDNYECFNLLMMKQDSHNVISWSEINIRPPKMGDAICFNRNFGDPMFFKRNDEIVMRMWIDSAEEEELVPENDGSVHDYYEVPATISESGKVEDLHYPRVELIIYNPVDGTIKKGPIGGGGHLTRHMPHMIYMETLVSLS